MTGSFGVAAFSEDADLYEIGVMKKENTLKLNLPGMRNLKTALCVLICLLITYFINNEITLYSSIAAIVCMQSTIENTLKIGVNRLVGTAIGGGVAMLLIPTMENKDMHSLFFVFAPLGIIFVIYICNIIKMPGSSVICAIVYLTVLIAPIIPSATTPNPYYLAVFRIIDTAIGIVVAMLINRYIAPPKLYEDREMHLVCNNFERVKSRVERFLEGDEALLLYDSSLTSRKGKPSQSPRISPDLDISINIPVPKELSDSKTIKTVYVSASYVVLPMGLKQHDGYVEIPGNLLPCTIVWQSTEEIKELPAPLK